MKDMKGSRDVVGGGVFVKRFFALRHYDFSQVILMEVLFYRKHFRPQIKAGCTQMFAVPANSVLFTMKGTKSMARPSSATKPYHTEDPTWNGFFDFSKNLE